MIDHFYLRKGVVAVFGNNDIIKGAGFFVTEKGYIVTCYHNLENNQSIQVGLYYDIYSQQLESEKK